MRKAFVFIVSAALLAACGGAEGTSRDGRTRRGGKAEAGLGRIDEGTRCDAKMGRESLVDLNQDDVPDVRKVYKEVNDSEVLVCREADMNFDKLAIGFNVTYLLDALTALDSETVTMELKDANSSCLISIPGGGSERHVVMPLKL